MKNNDPVKLYCSTPCSHSLRSHAAIRETEAEGRDGDRRAGCGGPPTGWPEDPGQADLWGLPQELQHEQGQGSDYPHRQDQHTCTLSQWSYVWAKVATKSWMLNLFFSFFFDSDSLWCLRVRLIVRLCPVVIPAIRPQTEYICSVVVFFMSELFFS